MEVFFFFCEYLYNCNRLWSGTHISSTKIASCDPDCDKHTSSNLKVAYKQNFAPTKHCNISEEESFKKLYVYLCPFRPNVRLGSLCVIRCPLFKVSKPMEVLVICFKCFRCCLHMGYVRVCPPCAVEPVCLLLKLQCKNQDVSVSQTNGRKVRKLNGKVCLCSAFNILFNKKDSLFSCQVDVHRLMRNCGI